MQSTTSVNILQPTLTAVPAQQSRARQARRDLLAGRLVARELAHESDEARVERLDGVGSIVAEKGDRAALELLAANGSALLDERRREGLGD